MIEHAYIHIHICVWRERKRQMSKTIFKRLNIHAFIELLILTNLLRKTNQTFISVVLNMSVCKMKYW